MEERLEKNEKDIRELKDVTLELSKSIERLAEELRESNVSCRREESATSEGSVLKMKGKMEEDSTAVERGTWEQALKWAADANLRRLRGEKLHGHGSICRNGLLIARQKEYRGVLKQYIKSFLKGCKEIKKAAKR
ncbi:hypothetical protein Csa_013556 [Cucumis sativus]|nr:hypothetical protein Csa_013556 [Cucumis sativus]